MSYLKNKYTQEIAAKLQADCGYKNSMEVPRLVKIVLNCTSPDIAHDAKVLNSVTEWMTAISGQKPVVGCARKSIAGFKLREGMKLSVHVTMRRDRMYEFMDRLIYIAMPRIRDFRGLSPHGFDGHGNYSFGIKEQIVFPEVVYDRIDKIRGFDVTICTSAKNNEEGKMLLSAFGMPFAK